MTPFRRLFAVDVMNESELPVITEETEEAKEDFLKRVIGSSVYDCGVAAKPDDVIIELVTCEYSGSNSRIAVYAKKIS